MSTPDNAALSVGGHCYCGAIRFAVRIPAGAAPLFSAYCHCDSCRRAHAAPLYHVVCVDESMLEVTAGQEALQEFTRPGGHIIRAFCGVCGSKILNRFSGWKPGGRTPIAFFPNLLDEETQRELPELLRPQRHNRPQESVLDGRLLADFFHL